MSTTELAAAEALLEIGRATEARRRLAPVLAAEPDNVDALCLLVRCYVALNDQPAALEAATAAAAADPGRAEAHILRASALVTLDRAAEGLVAAETALTLAPDRPAAHLVRALALFNTYRRKAAWAAMHEVIRLAPHWADAYVIHGSLHHTVGNHRRARRSYKRALALQPDHTGAMEGLGHLALRTGKLAAAVRQFGASAALAPAGQTATTGIDLALTGLYGWGLLAAWIALATLSTAGQYPVAWAIASGFVLAYSLWLYMFRRRISARLWAAARARVAADPRQRTRVVIAALTLALAVLIGAYELLHPVRPDNGHRALIGVFGSIGWLILAAVPIVVIDVRQARRTAAAAPPNNASVLGPAQESNVQIGRLTLRWLRTTALLAIVPSVLASSPAAPSGTRAAVGTAVVVLLASYYVWTVRRWRRKPGRPLSAGLAHLLPAGYFGLSVLWMATLAAAYWPGQPPGPTIAGFVVGGLVIILYVVWLPMRALRWAWRHLRT